MKDVTLKNAGLEWVHVQLHQSVCGMISFHHHRLFATVPLKSGDPGQGQEPVVDHDPADAINPGLTKMAESCPGTTYAKLRLALQARHTRDETYSTALAELVNAQFLASLCRALGRW